MTTSTKSATETSVEFGSENLLHNARVYADNKAIMNAASRYDNKDDAIAALTEVWDTMEAQIEEGAGYTPDKELGFGSDNAAVIAESILGRRNTVGATRKALGLLGK